MPIKMIKKKLFIFRAKANIKFSIDYSIIITSETTFISFIFLGNPNIIQNSDITPFW